MPEPPFLTISDLDGSSNAVRFDLDEEKGELQWNIVETGELVEKEFSLDGSMGETVCHHSGPCPNYYFGQGFDNSDGTLRLSPAPTVIGSTETGTAKGSHSTSTLQDTDQSWDANEWKHYQIFVNTGTAAGQTPRQITGNDSDTITFDPVWGSAPVNGDTYTINPTCAAYSPLTFFEDYDSDGDRAVYVDYRSILETGGVRKIKCLKIRASDDALIDAEDMASNADAGATAPRLGKVAVFEGKTYLPGGDETTTNHVIQELQVVGDIGDGTADTWNSDTSNKQYASSCAIIQEGTTNKFVAGSGNVYKTAAADPKDSTGYGSAWEVGDSTTDIVWTLEAPDGGVYFIKPDNVYTADAAGNTYPVLDFDRNIARQGLFQYDHFDGHMSTIIGSAILYPSRGGLERYNVAQRRQDNLAVDQIPSYRALPNITNIPIKLRHYAVVHSGRWIYAIYKPTGHTNTANVHILCGYYDDLAPQEITWRTFIYRAKDIIGLFIDSANKLWWMEDPDDAAATPGTMTSDLYYVQLAADGSPRTALGADRGELSTVYNFYLPQIAFPNQMQSRYMRVETEGFDATTSLQLSALRDEGGAATVGSAIVSDDFHQVEWTLGTADDCYRLQCLLTLTTNGSYNSASSDPRILRFLVGMRSPDVYRAVIKGGTSIDSALTIRKKLRQRKGGGFVQVTESWSGTQFKVQVVAVRDKETRTGEDGQLEYRTEVYIKRWDCEA